MSKKNAKSEHTTHPIPYMSMNKICLLLFLALIPIAVPIVAGTTSDIVYDDSMVYNLNNLVHKGSYSVIGDYTTYYFDAVLGDDSWYTSTISSTDGHTVMFRFKPNPDNTYSVIAGDFINARVGSTKYTVGMDPSLQGPPDLISQIVEDEGDDPYNLYDNITEECPWWDQEWSVESSRSKYLDKVHVEWEGESSFWAMCIWPYEISSTEVNYEGQIRSSTSGSENFDAGSPRYMVTVTWKYSNVI